MEMSGFIASLLSLFPKAKLGIIFSYVLCRGAMPLIRQITNRQNQQIAYYFVRQLNDNSELSNVEKAKMFNELMFKWTKEVGTEMCESVVNCLRELAVNVVKSEASEATNEN